ncbi:FmdB family zinc ribbon protein [Alkalilimnicola ehrlichii]|uniref:FmdB family zinc ribbon protein n=1 Tax=Alkalilimnicola ehrlichii TaxID=351052 RepID=UPI003B9FFC85
MPIYEYRCDQCAHELEAIQSMSDAPLTDCPECGAPALQRKISAAGFRLKGSGWYETDFKSGNRRNVADGGGGAESGGKKKESGGGCCGGGSCSHSKASA